MAMFRKGIRKLLHRMRLSWTRYLYPGQRRRRTTAGV
ncbi:hypothetical protein [Parageobacillus thermoglucosidasius]